MVGACFSCMVSRNVRLLAHQTSRETCNSAHLHWTNARTNWVEQQWLNSKHLFLHEREHKPSWCLLKLRHKFSINCVCSEERKGKVPSQIGITPSVCGPHAFGPTKKQLCSKAPQRNRSTNSRAKSDATIYNLPSCCCLFVCLFVCFCVCVCVCLSVCLSVCLCFVGVFSSFFFCCGCHTGELLFSPL